MNKSINIKDLDKFEEDKKNERNRKIVNSICGIVPYVGTTISEFITSFIPDNREERVISIIKELIIVSEEQGQKIDELENFIKNLKNNKMNSFLFETVLLNSMKTESKIKWHCYAYYVFSVINNKSIEDVQKEAILQTIEKLNEYEILHIIYLGYEKYQLKETDFHKKYGVFIDRHTACGNDEDKRFNAMQDSYLNNLVVYGIATCTNDPKRGNSSFDLMPYGQLIFKVLYDDKFFGK